MIQATGGYAEDVSDVEIVSGIQELAETEGIFTRDGRRCDDCGGGEAVCAGQDWRG